MKKLFLVVAVIFSLFLISCGDNDTGDSGDTGNTGNTGDTGDTGDTGNTGSDDDATDTGSDDDTGNTGSDDDAGDSGEIVYECVGVSVENITLDPAYSTYEGEISVGDETLEDLFRIEFYKEDLSSQEKLTVGTYNLAEGLNANYSSCTECVRVLEDIAEDGSAIAKSFFQKEGTIEITEVKEDTMESKGTLTAKVVEVTIADSTYESTPVADGACYEIQTSWNTICVPDCEGKVCGSDGCGGNCGDGCAEDEQCNDEGTECSKCTTITLDDIALGEMDTENNYWPYDGTFSPKIGDEAVDDTLALAFYAAPEAKTYDLAGTNFADCNECILVYEDLVPETSVAKLYFQEKGTIEVESFEAASGNVKATITGLQLREATIASDYSSTLIKDGKCLILETGTVEVAAE